MDVTLVISVYKDYEALNLVLDSVVRQSVQPQQIILAHDTIDPGIQTTLQRFISSLNMDHIDQMDSGFNKNRILNKAIIRANNEHLVFTDGDCILHPKFIEEHRRYLRNGIFTAGRRTDLDAKTSAGIRNRGIQHLGMLRMLLNGTKRLEEALYFGSPIISNSKTAKLLGCNMGWCKSDLEKLNGFDMDYTLPGYGEDTDIEFRAKLSGMKVQNMRWKALQYHLHHERLDREIDITQSRNLYESKCKIGYFYCENGLTQLS